jgi:uncharacterized glyoxalase superfamily metalloenzyme YdcJ
MLIDHMASGMTYESFRGVAGISKSTIYNWEEAHPEFLDAKELAFELNRAFWDRIALDAASGNKNVNATILIFNLKNRFPKEWRDRREIDVAGSLSQPKDDLKNLSLEDLKAIQEIHERANARKNSESGECKG